MIEIIVYPKTGANSFIEFDEADVYAQSSYYYTEWNLLSDEDKKVYLVRAFQQMVIVPGLVAPALELSYVIDDALAQVQDDNLVIVVSDIQTQTEGALECLPYAQVDLALWNLHQVNNPYVPVSSGSTGATIKKASVGPISVEYDLGTATATSTDDSCTDECPAIFPDSVMHCLEKFGADFTKEEELSFQQLLFTRGC